MRKKRQNHSAEFKAKVAMEAISGRKTLQEIAADHAIHPIQVSQWKKDLLERLPEVFATKPPPSVAEAAAKEDRRVRAEDAGANLFLEVRKPA